MALQSPSPRQANNKTTKLERKGQPPLNQGAAVSVMNYKYPKSNPWPREPKVGDFIKRKCDGLVVGPITEVLDDRVYFENSDKRLNSLIWSFNKGKEGNSMFELV